MQELQAAQELHFWGFTLKWTWGGRVWLLQATYLLSGHRTPGPLVMPAGNSSGSDPHAGRQCLSRGGKNTESPLKHFPPTCLTSFLLVPTHSALQDYTTHPDESTRPTWTFSTCRGWFSKAGSCRTQLQTDSR